jgi:Tfp pilus assembly protein PilF
LGILEMESGQLEKAQAFYEQALSANRQMGYKLGTGISLHNLGELHMMMGDYALARQYLLQATAVFKGINSPFAQESQNLFSGL